MGLSDVLQAGLQTSFGYVAILLLLVVGSIEGLRAIYRLASGIYVYFLRPGKDLKRLGSWAIVTGATDGIGLAYSKQLAKKGGSAGPTKGCLCATALAGPRHPRCALF